MQVFVKKSDLAANAAMILVFSHFDDLPWVDRNTFGSAYTPLSLPATAIVLAPASANLPGMYQLASNWRTNATAIANGESQRRILEVFSDYMQRNATNDLTRSQTLYSTTNVSSWPADAVSRYNEGLRGWNYVSAVRQASAGIASSLPNDPTDNSHWPTVISPPIYIPPQ